ncbi:MAG: 30S ribosomal protein S16 [Acidimicrobiia bacterium]
MAVKMRLMRMGKKKTPSYRVVVVDGRAPRDGRYIEQIGRYDPQQDPSLVEIDNEKAASWLSKGAQPTEAVEKLLNISGAMNTMKVRTGKIHTVGSTRPAAEEAANGTEEPAPAPAAVDEPVADRPEPAYESVTETPAADEPVAEEIAADTSNEEE